MHALKTYLNFWRRTLIFALSGGRAFYFFCGALSLLVLAGLYAYSFQFAEGLGVTNLSDQVSWGAYIANFTFLVGVAAAAILLVIPSYLYHDKAIKEVVLVGEVLAVAAIIMSLLFIAADLGRPDRFLHVIPFIGRLNFPRSVLAWDVVVLNGYLLLNLHIPGYLLYKKYRGQEPHKAIYLPFVFISIAWAVSIHTVTAFLYSGLGGRPYWNSAILAPRFLVSAFACGPALLTLALTILREQLGFAVKPEVFRYLRRVMVYTIPINLFLLGCEVFKEFYTDATHAVSAHYLYFGLYGHGRLQPYIWSAIALEIMAALVFAFVSEKRRALTLVACVATVIGIWVEKGMGLIIPGFVPTPLGDIVEYTPSVVEFFVCLGIWSFGTLLFTLFARVVVGIQSGRLREESGKA